MSSMLVATTSRQNAAIVARQIPLHDTEFPGCHAEVSEVFPDGVLGVDVIDPHRQDLCIGYREVALVDWLKYDLVVTSQN